MNAFTLRFGTIGILLLACAAGAQSAVTVRSISKACSETGEFGGACTLDFRDGNPAVSNASRRDLYVPVGGGLSGWDYAGEANAKARYAAGHADFALYARATGQRHDVSSSYFGPVGMTATALVKFHDEVTVAGSGFGSIVVPWHVTGGFGLAAQDGNDVLPPQGIFGATFCQSIPVGANAGGLGCTGGGAQYFNNAADFDQVLMLEYPIRFNQPYSLNTDFMLWIFSGRGLVSGMTGDFSHTGLQQPASVYDSNHHLILNPQVTSASGVDYLNPQATPVPEPASAALLLLGGLGILGAARRRAIGQP